MNFNSDLIFKNVARGQEIINSMGNNNASFFKVAYLPDGNHSIRVIPDKNMRMAYLMAMHKIGGNGKDLVACTERPSGNKEVCPICKALEKANEDGVKFDYSWGRATRTKMLCYLVDTDKPNDYWKPGNYYIVISNSYLFKGIMSAVSNIYEAANKAPDQEKRNQILQTLNPNAANVNCIKIKHKMGNQNSGGGTEVTLDNWQQHDKALNIPDGELVDLAEVYVNDLVVDQEKQNRAVDEIIKGVETRKLIEQSIKGNPGQQQVMANGIPVPPQPTMNIQQPTMNIQAPQNTFTQQSDNSAPWEVQEDHNIPVPPRPINPLGGNNQ